MNAETTRRNLPARADAPSHAEFRALFESTGEAILLLCDSLIMDANPAARKMFGIADRTALTLRYPGDLSPSLQPDGVCSLEKGREMLAIAERQGNHRFDWMHTACQSRFWAEVMLTRITLGDTTLTYALVRDITARKETEQTLRLAAQVFELGREAVLIADQQRRIVSVNRAFSSITGHGQESTLGRMLEEILNCLQGDDQRRSIFDAVEANGYWEGEAWDRRVDGNGYPQWLTIMAVRSQGGEISHHIVFFSDISERKSLEERARHMAEHDFLTGLPNRVLLLDRLGQAIASAKRNGTKFALMFLDLDRFKFVNDSMGHQVGDKLLQEVGRRLRKCVRAIDTVSRQGGDEFIILLADIGQPKQVARIAHNVMNEVGREYQIDGHEFSVTTSIGISTFPNDGEDIDTLIRNADVAMYFAKTLGRNGYQFFNDEMNTRIQERNALEHTLRNALDREEFLLHYQPEIDFASGRIVGAEALIRWDHPQKGQLLPTRFIAAAEECGLIMPIGQWVLRRACLQAKLWCEQGFPLMVSVNLSAAQFRHKDLAKSVAAALELSGLEPQYLSLELTESMLHDTEGVAEAIGALKELGVKLCIDDFGTGFFCLSYLRRFRVDRLKIDRSFVHEISQEVHDSGLVRAMVTMAKSLDMQIVAEGVETAQQFDYLRAIGCDQYQGNYASPPLPEMEPGRFLPSFLDSRLSASNA